MTSCVIKNKLLLESYYTRGRSANCDCIYLSQNYTYLPLHTIRSNSNFMVFFESSPLVVEQLQRNVASVDMNIKQFSEFCKNAWHQKHGYNVIDLRRDENKYRGQLNLINYSHSKWSTLFRLMSCQQASLQSCSTKFTSPTKNTELS